MNDLSIKDKNLIWAISEDYDLDFPEDLNIDNLDFYEKMALSYSLSLDSDSLLFEYLKYLETIDKHQTFKDMFILALSEFTYQKLLPIRPVIEDYKDEHFTNLKHYFQKHKRDDIILELKYTFMQRYFGEVPKTTTTVRDLASTISSYQNISSLTNLINSFEDLLDSKFFFSEALKDKEKKLGKNKFDPKQIKKDNKKDKNVLDDYYGLIGAAEFTTELDLDNIENKEREKVLSDQDDTNATDKFIQATNLFGNSIYTKQKIDQIESQICFGNHKNSKILISKGEYDPTNIEAIFRNNQLEESKEENLDYYNYLKNQFLRDERNMEKQIRAALIKDLDYTLNRSNHGNIIASNVYRNIYINDPNIFAKKIKFENSDISVDILIDSSASQLTRKARITSWAYTIANALIKADIPTRVMGFSNLENYLGLKVYRDYEDDLTKNKDIFKFLPAGSNRDGLAFRLVNNFMTDTKYRQKILIYLSDGKPYDIRSRIDNNYKYEERPYKDKFAEIDTSIEFRKLEQNDIYPLAIFTGNEEDLPSMKKIYGNNFAYIKDLNRFSSIITQYIKRVIEWK